jgi:Prokaryotic homologs of the JAB domain
VDDNLETGGWLFGEYESGVWVLGLATRLGSDGRRMHEAVQLDYSEAERTARDIRLGDSRLRLMGSWHCHPLWDAPRPSSTDRMNALCRLDWRELNPATVSVDLIVVPDRERGWSRPQFHAWSTRRTSLGTPVTAPARIVE